MKIKTDAKLLRIFVGESDKINAIPVYEKIVLLDSSSHIKILDKSSKEYARGLCSFSSNEVEKILGYQSKEIEKILGYTTKSEVVHKDDMVEV